MYDKRCANGIGRLCGVVTSESENRFSFDGAGRIVTSQQTTGGTAYEFAYE